MSLERIADSDFRVNDNHSKHKPEKLTVFLQPHCLVHPGIMVDEARAFFDTYCRGLERKLSAVYGIRFAMAMRFQFGIYTYYFTKQDVSATYTAVPLLRTMSQENPMQEGPAVYFCIFDMQKEHLDIPEAGRFLDSALTDSVIIYGPDREPQLSYCQRGVEVQRGNDLLVRLGIIQRTGCILFRENGRVTWAYLDTKYDDSTKKLLC